MLNPSDPSLTPPVQPVEPTLDRGAEYAFNDYINALSEWAESARIHHRFGPAVDAAREVLRETHFPKPELLLEIAPSVLANRIDAIFHPAAALALTVIANQEWSTARHRHGAEKAEHYHSARRYFEIACELEPGNIEYRQALHSLMRDARHEKRRSPATVLRETDEMLRSLTTALVQRFQFSREELDWAKLERAPDDRAALVWALDECASLSRARFGFVAPTDSPRANSYHRETIHFALCCFAAQGLPTDPNQFHTIDPILLAKPELKALLRTCHSLEKSYAALGLTAAQTAAHRLWEYVNFTHDHSPDPGNGHKHVHTLGERPTKQGEFPARAEPELTFDSAAVLPARTGAMPPRRETPVTARPPAPPHLTENAWLSPCRLAARDAAFPIPGKILRECTGPIENIRKGAKFPKAAIDKAIAEFAVEVDLLSRTQNESAALFLEHYRAFFDKYAKDPVALIRVQIGVAYLLDCPWISDGLKGPARALASMTNVTLQGMELRQDLATVQSIFRPITVAAKFNRLRPKAK